MLAEERFDNILKILAQRRSVTVQELCDALDASESTIRRDLILLHQQGRLNRVHGGATLPDSAFLTNEESMSAKEHQAVAQKQSIGRMAATTRTTSSLWMRAAPPCSWSTHCRARRCGPPL